MKSIAIIDYGAGNLRSIQKAFEYLGFDAQVTTNADRVMESDGIILPGVGAFPIAMESLVDLGMDKALKSAASSNKPILGVCLGMQLLFEKGYEVKECEGLGLLKGTVKKIEGDLKIPHMGWNKLNIEKNCALLKGIEESYVYFVHSFYVKLEESRNMMASTFYGSNIPAVVGEGNTFGMQFHPEKSAKTGLALLKNFGELIV